MVGKTMGEGTSSLEGVCLPCSRGAALDSGLFGRVGGCGVSFKALTDD